MWCYAQIIRVATLLAAVFILAVAPMAIGSAVLDGPPSGNACPEESEEDLGPCVHMQHVYLGNCQGSTCFTAYEWCCLPELIIIE
ncbi:hypothetical protein [Candidatus Palauibacter sp.]|uniref:hypothetical protein n=1 Tax=Candidatus Palauibacter sp. TaxID=3101350 RepID=UPI003D100ED0